VQRTSKEPHFGTASCLIRRTWVIPHDSRARPLILAKSVELPAGDLIGFNGILFRMVGAQVLVKAASDFRRQFQRLAFDHLGLSPSNYRQAASAAIRSKSPVGQVADFQH
jgi:hypothetical protein